MRPNGFISANFTITDQARRALAHLRAEAEVDAREPMIATMIGWGLYSGLEGEKGEGVMVGFYGTSDARDELLRSIQRVNGVDVVFFTLPEYARRFDGKTIDYAEERWFFLR